MSKFLVAALMLSLLNHGAGAKSTVSAWDDQDFFRYCPPSRCSADGPEIRFPLRLESSNTSSSCGATCAKLACSGQDTILLHPFLGPCKVTAIDYRRSVMKIIPSVDSLSPCPLQKLIIPQSLPQAYVDSPCALYRADPGRIVRCSREFTPSGTDVRYIVESSTATADYVAGPISCLSNGNHFSYLVYDHIHMSVLPLDCKVASNSVIPIPSTQVDGSTFKQVAESISSFAETTVRWGVRWNGEVEKGISYNCSQCELEGQRCAFSSQRNQTFCMRQRPHGIIVNWPQNAI